MTPKINFILKIHKMLFWKTFPSQSRRLTNFFRAFSFFRVFRIFMSLSYNDPLKNCFCVFVVKTSKAPFFSFSYFNDLTQKVVFHTFLRFCVFVALLSTDKVVQRLTTDVLVVKTDLFRVFVLLHNKHCLSFQKPLKIVFSCHD